MCIRDSIKGIRQAFMEGLTTGLKAPVSRGPRFALVHAGSEDGFINGTELNFLCKKNTANEHEEMDGETYEKWFMEQLVPNCPRNSVVVLDNAKYHSRYLEQIPTTSWGKGDIMNWLDLHNVSCDVGCLRREKLHLV